MLVRVLTVIAALLVSGAVTAQQDQTVPQVLIIDSEQLYLESGYGRAIRAEIDEAARALQAENEEIQSQLIAEEKGLTALRPTMSVEDFRAEAEAFDDKVQDIRRARDAKIAELDQAQVAGREQFFDDVRSVVGRLMLERGAVVLLDRRSVFLAVGSADITAEAIRRIDLELLGGPSETPEPADDTPTAPLIEPATDP